MRTQADVDGAYERGLADAAAGREASCYVVRSEQHAPGGQVYVNVNNGIVNTQIGCAYTAGYGAFQGPRYCPVFAGRAEVV